MVRLDAVPASCYPNLLAGFTRHLEPEKKILTEMKTQLWCSDDLHEVDDPSATTKRKNKRKIMLNYLFTVNFFYFII
jgi:hypothetical protein